MFQDAPDAPQGDREARPPTRKDVGAKQMFVERMQMIGRRKKSSGGSAGAEGRGAGDDSKEKGKAKSSGSGARAGTDGPPKKESAAAERLRERRKLRETRKSSQEVPQ